MRKLSVLDLFFFLLESEGSPKHVAGLMLCKKPVGSPANFGRKLIEELKSHEPITQPFNLIIEFLGLKGPHWRPCDHFNIDEHVFYHGSRKKISWLEAKDIAASLHEPILDRSRPLWEYHLIDGIEGGKFAVYTKIHHAYADGMTMAKWMDRSLSRSPDDMRVRPPWTLPERKQKKAVHTTSLLTRTIRGLTTQAWSQVLATGGIAKLATQQSLERLGVTDDAVTLLFNADNDTALTGSSSPGRSIATTWLAMEDVKQLCGATRSTLNHVALCCIDGAMHRYLDATGDSFDDPITIQMPVNLRSENDNKNEGNKLGVALVELASPTEDPCERLTEIGHSLHKVKKQINSVPGNAIEQFTVLAGLAGELVERLNLSNHLPATGHTLVSNLPGPRETCYLKGARVEQMCPISVLVPGLHMNITLFSCGGILNIGIVATKDLPELNLLAQYTREEFHNLEKAIFEDAI